MLLAEFDSRWSSSIESPVVRPRGGTGSMSRYSLSHVGNRKLLRNLVALVAQERARAAALLALLAEADARGLDVPGRTEIEEELAELLSPAEMQAMVQAIHASPPLPDEQLAPAQVEA